MSRPPGFTFARLLSPRSLAECFLSLAGESVRRRSHRSRLWLYYSDSQRARSRLPHTARTRPSGGTSRCCLQVDSNRWHRGCVSWAPARRPDLAARADDSREANTDSLPRRGFSLPYHSRCLHGEERNLSEHGRSEGDHLGSQTFLPTIGVVGVGARLSEGNLAPWQVGLRRLLRERTRRPCYPSHSHLR